VPELAEVEYNRRRWDPGIGGKVTKVQLHQQARDFRGAETAGWPDLLEGAVLLSSQARGKQILFRFSRGLWLGIHLGMTGGLRIDPTGSRASANGRHDHLRLCQQSRTLVFSDPRQFGRVILDRGSRPPAWWAGLPPDLLSRDFSRDVVAEFLHRHGRAPLKAVLLMQERFPGVGNWMADEILWRCGLHPARPAGGLNASEVRSLWREIRTVARISMRTIAPDWSDPPRGWLFHHRWSDGGLCPRTGVPLVRETIGGRTTCWSPGRQVFVRSSNRKSG
jgi:formamidopyrimidine-DNA glycosylase